MIHGLRWRLTISIVLITLFASAVVGVGLGRYTRSEFEQFLKVDSEGPPIELEEPTTLIERMRTGDLPGIRSELSSLKVELQNVRLLLFGPDLGLIQDTDPGGEVTLGKDGTLEIAITRDVDGAQRKELLTLRGGLKLGDPDEDLGTLFALPDLQDHEFGPKLPAETGFTRTVGRAHLVGIVVATSIALFIALFLSGRIVGPLERLTGAARRLARGDLTQRVDVRSRDEIGELGEAFNAMAASLQDQEHVRKNMVSDIAHELRTPLTHLRCKLESVQDGLVTPDENLLQSLHQETIHLGHLVDDLQELALAEAGQLPLFPAETDLTPVVRLLVSTLPSGEDSPSVAVEMAADLHTAHVDIDRFRQVLRNLLQNALRYGSTKGNIVVRLYNDAASRDGKSTIRCEVQDDGPGIAADHLDRVFERFHRTDPSRDRASGGAGLGLAISRQLVLAWEGHIGVESSPGSGAKFWFTVPVAQSE